ncbi:uncharacterized protein K441DRAFT_668981 [Cenococcum geophilum 1.58]|uniref:uncharacterized protein n=1 Tax=Cenococcum geophilum 1.58 TaxID=794803 RepID=UPI00358F2A49|nr:hypothetical protein K441DRAFT_668981 [Cenococcum geophilum 1.58]
MSCYKLSSTLDISKASKRFTNKRRPPEFCNIARATFSTSSTSAPLLFLVPYMSFYVFLWKRGTSRDTRHEQRDMGRDTGIGCTTFGIPPLCARAAGI